MAFASRFVEAYVCERDKEGERGGERKNNVAKATCQSFTCNWNGTHTKNMHELNMDDYLGYLCMSESGSVSVYLEYALWALCAIIQSLVHFILVDLIKFKKRQTSFGSFYRFTFTHNSHHHDDVHVPCIQTVCNAQCTHRSGPCTRHTIRNENRMCGVSFAFNELHKSDRAKYMRL